MLCQEGQPELPGSGQTAFFTSLVTPSLRMPKYSLTPSMHRPALLLLAFPPVPGTPSRLVALLWAVATGRACLFGWLSPTGRERASPLLLQLPRKHTALPKLPPGNESTCSKGEATSGQAEVGGQQDGHKVILAEAT